MISIRIDKTDKCNGEYSLFISFPYSNRIVEVIRDFPSRYWHKDDKEWELPLTRLDALVEKLPAQEFDIHGPYISLAEREITIPDGFSFKTEPFSHQIDGFEFGLSHDCWLLGDEQGLGKTKQVIDIAVAMKLLYQHKESENQFDHCLIVCGVNGLKWNWLNEIETHSDEHGYIIGERWKAGKRKVGSTKDKTDDLEWLLRNPKSIKEYFLITNVESLRNAAIHNYLAELCANKTIGMVAIDEIHKCKNPSSQQGKGILKLDSEYKIAMTGTPLMNNPTDLFIILKWLGYEKHAFYAFKRHYCVMGGFGGYEVIGYKNLDELQERLASIMLRRLKKDVLDLPEKTRINEYVEMTLKQEQIYREVHADIKANIDQIKMTNNPLAELIRLRQATGYTGILSSTIRESAKLDRMIELVEEALENNKKVVIFSNWAQMTDAVDHRLAKTQMPNSKARMSAYTACITGETPDSLRQEIVDAFQNTEDLKILVGTIGAMGTGLTLTAGTVEIFMDEPWNMALKEQAEDRCHRVGTTENITIYTLLCKNTIDERINDLVERKGLMADALVDGNIVGDRRELLDFLLA